MRKVFKSTLAVAMAVSLLATTANAQSGPRGWYDVTYEWMPEGEQSHRVYGGSISFYEYNEDGTVKQTADGEDWVTHEIFVDGEVKNGLQGASYDLASNTLTLRNLNQPYMKLNIGQMGDDFKLKVEGDCSLGAIEIYVGGNYMDKQKGYDTSMAIEGSGTLTITTAKKLEGKESQSYYSSLGRKAIEFYAGGADCKLYIGKDVTLNLYGDENAICFRETSAEVPVRFENGQKADVTVEENIEARIQYVPGYLYQAEEGHIYNYGEKYENASDPEGIYVGHSWKNSDGETVYEVNKYRYVEKYKAYIPDWSFGDQGFKSYTAEEFKAEGFTSRMVRRVDSPKWIENKVCSKMIQFQLAEDENGKTYGIFHTGTLFDGYETAVFDKKLLEDTKGQYLLTINPDVDIDSLKKLNEYAYGYYLDENDDYPESWRDTICKADPDGIYGSMEVTTSQGEGEDKEIIFEGVEVYKLIYLEDLDLYIMDKDYTESENASYSPKKFSYQEFDEQFEVVCDLGPEEFETDSSLDNYVSAEVYKDENGTLYGVRENYSYDEDESGNWVEKMVKEVYTLDPCDLFDGAEEQVYIMVPAEGVEFDKLTQVLKPLEGNAVYDCTSGKSFTYEGGTVAKVTTEEIKEQKTTEKPTEQPTTQAGGKTTQQPTGGDGKTTEQPTTQAGGKTTQQPTTQAGGKTTEQPTTQAGSKVTEQPTTQAGPAVTETPVKKAQAMKVTVKKPTVKLSKLKKKKQTVTVLAVKNAQGTVTYEKVKKGSASQLTINRKTGKVTVKKGTKKGTYKIKINVTAAGNDEYLKAVKTVTAKIKVK